MAWPELHSSAARHLPERIPAETSPHGMDIGFFEHIYPITFSLQPNGS